MDRAGTIDALLSRAASLLALYRCSQRRWRFPLVSLFANLWLARILRWCPDLRRIPPAARMLEAVLATNAAVHDALWAAWEAPESTPTLTALLSAVRGSEALSHRALFEATLCWEQREVVAPALASVLATSPRWLRAGMHWMPMQLASGWVLYRDFLSTDARIETTLRTWPRLEAIGWEALEAKAARALQSAGVKG